MGGGDSTSSQAPALSALKIQNMGYGTPIQLGYGSNRISPTLGWTGDFYHTEQEDNSSGGKGGGAEPNKTYTYYAAILMLVCEGEIRGYGKQWHDKAKYNNLSGFTFATLGTETQAAWDYLTTKHPTEALTYNGTAYAAASNYQLGDGASLGNHSFEVFGRCLSAVNTDQNYLDAHIKDVITDFLTHPRYGAISAQTTTLIVESTQMHAYCVARGLLISPVLDASRAAHEWITEWMTIANAGIVWSEGILKLIPYADQDFSNSFGSYTANTTIRAHFDDDFIEEPINPTRKKIVDCYNNVKIECLNRANDYNKHTLEVKDQAAIENFGLRTADALTLNSICLPDVAMIVSQTQLLRGLYIRNTYEIKTFCETNFDLLEPMDFITITDANLGLDALRCRITSIDDAQEGNLTITVEEAPEGVYCG